MATIIYDIRNQENAQRTLEALTGISFEQWDVESYRIRDYTYEDYFIDAVLEENDKDIPAFSDLNFVFSHITTSGNGCVSISRHGLIDLRKAYSCEDSELRQFLEFHDVRIDIDDRILRYKDKSHDISFERYGSTPSYGTAEYMAWSVGRKLYFDFTVCGFLSIDRRSPYGGNVHLTPEILQDIDNLLKTHLAEVWVQETRAYEVVARAKGVDIVIDAEGSDRDQMIAYILNAYHEACFLHPPFVYLYFATNTYTN